MKDALRMARAFKRLFPWIEVADLDGAAIDGLVAAAQSFDGRDVPFWAYARKRVWGKMLDLVEWRNRRPSESLEVIKLLGVRMADPPSHRMLNGLVAELPERLRLMLRLRFIEGMSQAEAGRHIGVKQARASQLERRTLAQLRAELALRGVRKLADAL